MKTLQVIRTNLQKTVTSYGFWVCTAITMMICFSAEIHYDYSNNEAYSVFSALLKFKREEMLTNTDFSFYNILVKGNGGWLTLFIPIAASFPIIPLLCDERDYHYVRYSTFRTSRFSYNAGGFISALIAGGLSVLLGFVLFSISVVIMFPSINDYDIALRETYEWWIPDTYPLFSKFGYSYLVLLKYFETFLYGAFSAVTSIVLTGIMKNRYLIMCIPFFLKYMMVQTYFKLRQTAYFNIESPNTKLISFLEITDPDALKALFSYGNDKWKISLFCFVMTFGAFIIYCILMNRRLDYGE